MTNWFYVNKFSPGILNVTAVVAGPDHLWMHGTRRPRKGRGYGFFLVEAEAEAFLAECDQ